MRLEKIFLLIFLFNPLLCENFKVSYDVYVKFPCWIKIGKASYEEKKECLEGRIELKGILRFIARLTSIKEVYKYQTIYEKDKIIYWEGEKKYCLEKDNDILSIIKNLRNYLVNENFSNTYELFIDNEYRKLKVEKEKEKIAIYGLPLINIVTGKMNGKIPELLETNFYGIKFKGILDEH
jgi:hypothetical protein